MTPGRPETDGLRVQILVPSLAGGGAEFVARTWAQSLTDAGHRVGFVVTHPKQSDRNSEFDMQVITVRGFLPRVLSVRRAIHATRPDVLLCLMPHWNLLGILSTRGQQSRPLVVISGRNADAPLRSVHGWKFRIESALARLLYRLADGYVAISHPVASEAASYYRVKPSRIWVVPNPAIAKVDHEKSRQRREDARSRPRSGLSIVVPARLVAQKRPTLALDVAHRIWEVTGYAPTVVYFGDGPMRDAVQNHAATIGVNAEFRGWVDDWFSETPPNAVALLPSISEGFGNVLLEAAANGIPSVASSRALGVADAILPGVTGVLSSGDSPHALAQSVLEAAQLDIPELDGWFLHFSEESSSARLVDALVGAGVSREP